MLEKIKQTYYTYQPGEFLPVRVDGKLTNKREFHMYRIKWLLKHRDIALYQFTHYSN